MYMFFNYTIVPETENKQFEKYLVEKLGCIHYGKEFVREEDSERYRLELLLKGLKSITDEIPDVSFTCKGVCDASSGAGEYMNVWISYRNREYTIKTSGWYVYVYKDDYETYDDMVDEYGGNPPMTEDEFEEWDEEVSRIGLDSGEGDIVREEEIPMEEISLEEAMQW